MEKIKNIFRKIFLFTILFNFLFVQFVLSSELRAEEGKGLNYYNSAVKKYINNDLNGALLDLDRHSKANPQDGRVSTLRSLIMGKKGGSLDKVPEEAPAKEVSAEDTKKANEYFSCAFKKYLEGNLVDASAYLHKAKELDPNFEKADRFLKVIERRQEGAVQEDSAFIKELFKEIQEETLLPEKKSEERVSADFKNEDVNNILRVLSQLYNVNIVAGNDIDAKITVSLTDVTLEEALDSILNAVGYSYVKEGNVIRVVDRDSYILTKTFELNNISLIHDRVSTDETESATDTLIEKLEEVLSDDGQLFYDEVRRTLMVTDTVAKIEVISKLISKIDVFSPQILIEAKIIELTPSYNETIGIDWSVLEGYAVTVESPEATYQYEFEKSFAPSQSLTDTEEDTGNTFEYETAIDRAAEWTLERALSGTLSADNFQLVLSALQSDTDARVVSSPNVLTEGGREAYITISDQYPIPSYTYNEETGSFEVSGFEFKDIGVILTVIPYPIEDDYVSLSIIPEVSKESGTASFGGARIPIISTTKIKTHAFIKSGHTLALGGLIKEENEIVEKKVPILGDIPLLKNFFSHKETDTERRNVIIFITPTIITKENMDLVTVLQSKKLGPDYELKVPEAKEEKTPPPKWGRKYRRKKIGGE